MRVLFDGMLGGVRFAGGTAASSDSTFFVNAHHPDQAGNTVKVTEEVKEGEKVKEGESSFETTLN